MPKSLPEHSKMLYSGHANEPVNSHSYTGTEDFKWNRESVMILISLYHSNKSQFDSGFVKKRDLWAQIAAEMSSRGLMVNLVACEKKWHNLCATYRRLKDCSMKKRNHWPYFQPLQELLDGNSEIHNLNHSNSAIIRNENSCNVVKVESNSSESHSYEINSWMPAYQPQMRVSPNDGETNSCDKDVTNMLSVNLEENSECSQAPREQLHIPSTFIHGNTDDFKWNHNSVMLLCSLYLIRKDQFFSGCVKKRDLWTEIAQEMNREGFPVTFIACEKKWHNLIATYKKVSMYSRKKTWPYLHFFEKIIEEQMLHSASFGFTDNPYLSNSYSKELSGNDLGSSQIDKEEVLNSDDALNYVEPIKNSFEDFRWTHVSVISLCSLYKENREKFISNTVRKKDLWMEIACEMNSQGYNVSWVSCEKKWYNLYATYKKVTDQNRKRTRVWSTWPYLKLFQDIFATQSDHEPQVHQPSPCNFNNVCSPQSQVSDHSLDASQIQSDCIDQSVKRQCLSSAPDWFLDYCRQQQLQEEHQQIEAERRHRELLNAINIGNATLMELSSSIKAFLNKDV